ncbi:MAG: hypothetical protein LBI05_04820 [Planctomycetaceae bacterium]|nr:hypothetical protein [Planctomycetaceae bacterium]
MCINFLAEAEMGRSAMTDQSPQSYDCVSVSSKVSTKGTTCFRILSFQFL